MERGEKVFKASVSEPRSEKTMPQEFSAGAVVFYRDRRNGKIEYLILRYGAGHWDFPKGHIEKGEAYFDTVRREVEEETGIKKIAILPGFKEQIRYFMRPKGAARKEGTKKPWVFKMVTFFAARAKTKKVTLSHEHVGCLWLPYPAALKRVTYKNAKNILKKADYFIRAYHNHHVKL